MSANCTRSSSNCLCCQREARDWTGIDRAVHDLSTAPPRHWGANAAHAQRTPPRQYHPSFLNVPRKRRLNESRRKTTPYVSANADMSNKAEIRLLSLILRCLFKLCRLFIDVCGILLIKTAFLCPSLSKNHASFLKMFSLTV